VLQVVLPLPNVDDGGGHLSLFGVVSGLPDSELAGAVGNDALLPILKLNEYSSYSLILLTPVCVQDELVFRVESGVGEDGRVK
jgi:hypothetical protein